MGGNGGMKLAQVQLLKVDVPLDHVILLLDRYLMFYFRTAGCLQRTTKWLENLDGRIVYLRDVLCMISWEYEVRKEGYQVAFIIVGQRLSIQRSVRFRSRIVR